MHNPLMPVPADDSKAHDLPLTFRGLLEASRLLRLRSGPQVRGTLELLVSAFETASGKGVDPMPALRDLVSAAVALRENATTRALLTDALVRGGAGDNWHVAAERVATLRAWLAPLAEMHESREFRTRRGPKPKSHASAAISKLASVFDISRPDLQSAPDKRPARCAFHPNHGRITAEEPATGEFWRLAKVVLRRPANPPVHSDRALADVIEAELLSKDG